MCDATRLYVVGQVLDPQTAAFWFGRLRCEACHWPDVHAVVGSDTAGCFVLCRACCERLALQTALAIAFTPRPVLI
jgi:hypothetical protein